MTEDQATEVLVTRILRWKVGPDRFLTGGSRTWVPRWRFQPFKSVAGQKNLIFDTQKRSDHAVELPHKWFIIYKKDAMLQHGLLTYRQT